MRQLAVVAVFAFAIALPGSAAPTSGGLARAAPPAGRSVAPRSVDLGGTPLQLVSAGGALWALTCDRACSGEGKRSVGRIVEIAPRNARVIASTKLARPGAIAVGTGGVYATDFWRGNVRRLDRRTLRLSATLHLKLPFFITTSTVRDDAFLPEAIAVGGGGVWVATARGALARTDPHLRHVLAMLRLPGDAFQAITVTPNALSHHAVRMKPRQIPTAKEHPQLLA